MMRMIVLIRKSNVAVSVIIFIIIISIIIISSYSDP